VELYGADRVFRFPLDFGFVVSRVLRRVRPRLIVLMELEVWPNFIRLAARRGTPVVIANGRLTEHSARRLRRLGPLARSMFRRLAWVGAQDEVIAERFRGLGVAPQRIEVTSSLKWDTALITDAIPGEGALCQALSLNGSRPVWVCGSTGPGEEAIVLDAYRRLRDKTASACPVLVIVPRKPERFAEVARLVADAGFQCVRRSTRPDGSTGPSLSGSEVILGDTMGELRKFYSRADVVFVGRSLVPMGGSDSMEVAALGKPILTGPHNDNFAEAVDQLRGVNGLRLVDSAATLAQAVEDLLADPDSARAMGGRAREVVRRRQGATDRTLAVVLRFLDAAGGGGDGGQSP
jgi:3-deoxy-D-manno-octulosonic-acid transferase